MSLELNKLEDRLETIYNAKTNLSNEYSQVWDEINFFIKQIKESEEVNRNNIRVLGERNNVITQRSELLCDFLRDIGYSDKEINNIIKLRSETV